MGKECGAWVSRRLWGGGNSSPLKTTAWEATYDMENGALKSGSRIPDYPYSPQSPAQPSPLSQLPLCHFAPHQKVSIGSQFPVSVRTCPASSAHDFCSLFTSTVADLHAEESFLFSLQVATSFRGMILRLNIFKLGYYFEIFVFDEDVFVNLNKSYEAVGYHTSYIRTFWPKNS